MKFKLTEIWKYRILELLHYVAGVGVLFFLLPTIMAAYGGLNLVSGTIGLVVYIVADAIAHALFLGEDAWRIFKKR